VQLGEALHHRQADAESAAPADRARLALHEELEDPGQDVARDTDAGIAHTQDAVTALARHADLDGAARRRVFDRVVEQVLVLGAVGRLGRGARRALARQQRFAIVLGLPSRRGKPGDADSDDGERDDRCDLVPRRRDGAERRNEPVIERHGADDDGDDRGAEAGHPGHDHDGEQEWR